MKHVFNVMMALSMLSFISCQTAEQLQAPRTPRSQSEVTSFGLLRLSANVVQSGAYEITNVFCDYVMHRTVPVTEEPGPTGPDYGPDGELIDPVVANATYDPETNSVQYILSAGEMMLLGDRLIVYRWVIEYRLPGGADIATSRSEIFQTSPEDAVGEGNDLVIVF